MINCKQDETNTSIKSWYHGNIRRSGAVAVQYLLEHIIQRKYIVSFILIHGKFFYSCCWLNINSSVSHSKNTQSKEIVHGILHWTMAKVDITKISTYITMNDSFNCQMNQKLMNDASCRLSIQFDSGHLWQGTILIWWFHTAFYVSFG